MKHEWLEKLTHDIIINVIMNSVFINTDILHIYIMLYTMNFGFVILKLFWDEVDLCS